jgi:hypothetical protein
MIITETGILVSTDPNMKEPAPLNFKIEGGQVGENQIRAAGLDSNTTYYAQSYFVKDGMYIRQKGVTEFKTSSQEEVLKIKNAYAGYNNISLLKSGSPSAISLDYSTNGGTTWTTWNSSSGTYLNANLPENGELWLKGENYRINNSNSAYWYFTSEHIFDCEGSLSAIIDRNTSIIPDYCFCRLFYNTAVRTAPDIPAMYLANSCFNLTFLDCTSLTSAPALPATAMAASCYRGMFQGCTSLVNAPSLPATSLADYCYYAMFQGCTSLVTAPALPATTIAANCYSNMFQGCTSLVNAPSLPATTLAASCYAHLFYGCTSLVTAPALPATTIATGCYAQMFYGCTSLVTAPALPATTLAANCFKEMFRGCTSLVNAPALPATTMAESCYYGMLMGCTSLVNAPALPATTLAASCYQNLFSGCTSLTAAPALPATTLASSCYNSMFNGCTSLTAAPALPATTPIKGCYTQMFRNCSSIVQIICYATTWNTAYASNWVSGVAASGDFYNLGGATIPTDNLSGVPIGWTVYNTLGDYLTITNEESGQNTITLTKVLNGTEELPLDITLEYSTDGGTTWTTWSSANSNLSVTINQGGSIKLKGNNSTFSSNDEYGGGLGYYYFGSTGNFSLSGNMMALLDDSITTVPAHCFSRAFENAKVTTVSRDLLPATNLGTACYQFMFWCCTSLTQVPELPATTLADSCYSDMFYGCTSLASVPSDLLPSTTLAWYCYAGMFENCRSMATAPVLPATAMTDYCYVNMFDGCTSLNSITTYAQSWNITNSRDWVLDVSATGDFYDLGGANIPAYSSGMNRGSGRPYGWTVHTSL